MVKLFAFDFGGVLAQPRHKNFMGELLSILNITKEQWRSSYFKFNHLSNTSDISWSDVMLLTARDLNIDENKVQQAYEFSETYNHEYDVNYELIEIVKDLKSKGFITAIISNFGKDFIDIIEPLDIQKYFDHIIFSYNVGYQKPDPRIFEALANKAGVLLTEIVVVDDTPRSLESSSEIGFTPILFTTNEEFKNDLKKFI